MCYIQKIKKRGVVGMFKRLLCVLLFVLGLYAVGFADYYGYDGMDSYGVGSSFSWIEICFWLVFGFLAAEMARNRGRSPLLAFILGILCGVFALIGYWIAGDKKEKVIVVDKSENEAKKGVIVVDK